MSALWSMDETFVDKEKNELKEEMFDPQVDEWVTWNEIQVCFHKESEYKNSKLCFQQQKSKN